MKDIPTLGVCILTMNSEVSIGYVLSYLLKQDYPKDRLLYLIVDGGSSDRTLEIVRRIFGEYPGLSYDIVVATGSNIPQARNVCLEKLLQVGVDYILFVDSDTVVTPTNALQLITQLAEDRRSLIYFAFIPKYFKNVTELHKFVSGLQPSKVSVVSEDLVPSLQIGMGFTIIPRELAATVRFDEDMDFGEDHLYALKAFSTGYIPYKARRVLPIYDVNVAGSRGDIYWRMPARRYLRSVRKKTLRILIASIEDGLLKFSYKRLLRILIKHIVNSGLVVLLILLPVLAVKNFRLFIAGALAELAVTSGYAIYKKLKGFSLVESLKNRLKFELFSFLTLLSLPLTYRDFLKYFRKLRR